MALFRHVGSGQQAAVRALIAADAAEVIPGAGLDEQTHDLLVPIAEGRARVSTDDVVAAALEEPEPVRPELIRRWLVDVAAQLTDAQATALPPAPESLRIQISPSWAPEARAQVTAADIPTCFDAIVCYRAEERLVYLPSNLADGYGGELEAARIAVRHTIQQELLDVDVRDHDAGGFQLTMIAKDGSPFVTTALMSLERFLPDTATDALVIAPRYSSVAVMPVGARNDIGHAARLLAVTEALAENADDPCSASVYWWHADTFYALDFDPDGTVVLPPEIEYFVAVLP